MIKVIKNFAALAALTAVLFGCSTCPVEIDNSALERCEAALAAERARVCHSGAK